MRKHFREPNIRQYQCVAEKLNLKVTVIIVFQIENIQLQKFFKRQTFLQVTGFSIAFDVLCKTPIAPDCILDWIGMEWTQLDSTGMEWNEMEWNGMERKGKERKRMDCTAECNEMSWTALDCTGLDRAPKTWTKPRVL